MLHDANRQLCKETLQSALQRKNCRKSVHGNEFEQRNEFERSRIEEFDNKTTSNKNCKKCVPSHDLPVRLLHFGRA